MKIGSDGADEIRSSNDLIYLVRARLAAGEPFSTIVEWLVTERRWKSGREGAETWLSSIANLSPEGEHPAITRKVAATVAAKGKCGTCGRALENDGPDRCNACWEVERRLRDYVKSPYGRGFVRQVMYESTRTTPGMLHVLGDRLVDRTIKSIDIIGGALTLHFDDGTELCCLTAETETSK